MLEVLLGALERTACKGEDAGRDVSLLGRRVLVESARPVRAQRALDEPVGGIEVAPTGMRLREQCHRAHAAHVLVSRRRRVEIAAQELLGFRGGRGEGETDAEEVRVGRRLG